MACPPRAAGQVRAGVSHWGQRGELARQLGALFLVAGASQCCLFPTSELLTGYCPFSLEGHWLSLKCAMPSLLAPMGKLLLVGTPPPASRLLVGVRAACASQAVALKRSQRKETGNKCLFRITGLARASLLTSPC